MNYKDASSGPFAQFQNCGDDEDSLTKLVFQLVNRIPNSEPDKETIKFQVGKFMQTVGEILKKLDGSGAPESTKKSAANLKEIENSSAKLFEEIKIMFQDLPSRIERANLPEGHRRKRRFQPVMIEAMLHLSKNPKIGLKIALSLYREKMPWVYDEGIVLLRKLDASKNSLTNKRVMHEFEELLMQSTRTVDEFMLDDEEERAFFMALQRVILRNLELFVR